MKAILFGASGGGERLFDEISKKYTIVAVVDNDERKWQSAKLRDIQVEAPEVCVKNSDYDVIVVTSAPGKDSITQQLISYGVPEHAIITSYVEQPLESRRIFLERLSQLHKQFPEKICVAEAGVFQGDFAKYINEYYPGRKLYLFDTFEGFTENDIKTEKQFGFSSSLTGDYNNTSEQLVLSKMKHPDHCIIKKGFFPQTVEGVEEQFCFVNLDMDLYEPTLSGLKWFENRMIPNGIILVHDYFAENFRGVREAVDTYMKQTVKKNLKLLPIGDGISIAVTGY